MHFVALGRLYLLLAAGGGGGGWLERMCVVAKFFGMFESTAPTTGNEIAGGCELSLEWQLINFNEEGVRGIGNSAGHD